MRLRATRLSVTGGHARKRGIDIAALFAGYPGRVGCYYGTKSGPSYTDILARNREALGPERVTNGDFSSGLVGWIDASTAPASVSAALGVAAITSNGNTGRLRQTISTTPGTWCRLQFRVVKSNAVARLSIGTTAGGTDIRVATAMTDGVNCVDFVATTSTTWLNWYSSADFSVDDVSAREIVDWQKLVLFDDPNGTVPVFSVFQSSRGRGLLLDSSQGLVRGPELIANGDFSSGSTGWTLGPETSVAGGKATIASTGAASALSQVPAGFSSTKWYEVSFDATVRSGSAKLEGAGGSVYVSIATTRRYTCLLTGVGGVIFNRVTACDIDIDNVSVRELPGNHMVQPTAAARGELSARYNQFEATEDLAAAYWSIANTTVLGAAVLSPRGTMTGARLESTGADTHGKTVTAPVGGAAMAFKKFVQRGNHDWVRFTFLSGANEVQAWFNIATGTAGTARGVGTGVLTSATITDAGGGWWECTLTGSIPAAASYQCLTSTANADLSFGRVSGGVRYEWGADLRLAADVIPSIPSYQRVTSATDYDDVGFPVYHREQTDDWAKTRINPNGATKVLAMWGGQKLSDSSESMMLESSVSSSNNPGTFALWQTPPAGMGQQMRWRSRGSGNADVLGGLAAPARVVAIGVGSISDDSCALTVNGVVTSSSSDQGTGTYIEQDVYFGARAGTSLFANIREVAPPMILFQQPADSGLSASQVSALNKAYGRAVGVSL